jgi:hypothetical protein
MSARLQTGEGFAAAAMIAVRAVEALAASRPAPGAYSPAAAFGADFIGSVPDVRISVQEDGKAVNCCTFAPAAIIVASIACCSVVHARRRRCRAVKSLLDARLRGHDKGGGAVSCAAD